MANEDKTEKPGQVGGDNPAARPLSDTEAVGMDAGASHADRSPGVEVPVGEVPADTPATINESTIGAPTNAPDEATDPRPGPASKAARDDAFAAAPLRAEPSRSDAHAESREDTARRPAPPPTVVKSGGGGRGFVGGVLGSLLALGAVGAVGYVTQDRWMPPVASMVAGHAAKGGGDQAEERLRVTDSINILKSESAEVRSQFSSVGTRLQSLQQEIDTLRQQSEKTAASAAAATAAADRPMPDIAQPLEDINQRLSQVEVGSARLSALEQRLADVQMTLSNVQSTVAKGSEQASLPSATVLAVNQLADALNRSGAFAPELESVRAIAAGDTDMAPAIGTLEQWSRSGVPTLGQIRAGFPAMAEAVAQTQFQSEGEGWFDDVRNRLSALVTVRKVGDAAIAGGGVDGALAQADAALASGDLAGAVNVIEGLEGPAADAASAWLGKARERLAADKALADLRTVAIAKLNAARG